MALTALAALLMAACGGDSDDGLGSGFGSGATNGQGGATGQGGQNGTGNTGTGPILGGFNAGGASGVGGGVGTGGACATGMAKADLTPVNMFIQFDRSGSMNDDNKWPQAAQALTAFFQDAATGGLRVALRFFPHDDPAAGCTSANDACSAMACSQPKVPLGEVQAAAGDPQETALVSAVMTSAPPPDMGGGQSGGTPLYAALDGALIWARGNQTATPGERTVVVLVTDGEPNGCNEDIDDIAGLAQTAFMQNQIPTYAIGIAGASEDQMDQIAEAGGTMQAFFAGDAMNAQQDLINALNAIRGSVVACDFPVPTGDNVDPTRININYTPGGTGTPELIGQAPDLAGCGNVDNGWYYTGGQTRITLCPTTCDRVTADPAAQLDVLLGCMTQVQPPR